MPLLCLRLLSEARTTEDTWSMAAEWLIREDDGSIRGQGVTDYRGLCDLLDPAQAWLAESANVLVLIPHDNVLELNVTVPGRSGAQIRRALPYAVEEFATTDIENLHIATDSIRPGQPVRVQLIERDLIRGWLDCLRSLNLQPGQLLVDTELLEVEEGFTTVLIDGSGALLRTTTEAAAVDRPNLVLGLSGIGSPHVRIINGTFEPAEEAALPESVLEYVDTGETALEYLAGQWRAGHGINLLQGEFAPARKKGAGSVLWPKVGMVASFWIVLAWGLMIAEGWWASRQTESLQAEAQSLFASWFPDAGEVRNPRRALAERIGQSVDSNSPGFATLTSSLVTALDPAATVRTLEFEQQSGELRAEVVVQNHADVEALRSRLTAAGLSAELQSATQEENRIRASIVLRQST